MTPQLDLYKRLNSLHEEMADAALAADWDRAIELDHESDQILSALRAMTGGGATKNGAEERLRIATLIEQILASQTTIREQIKGWQSDVGPFLAALDNKVH